MNEEVFETIQELFGTRIALITNEISGVPVRKAIFEDTIEQSSEIILNHLKENNKNSVMFFSIDIEDVILANNLLVAIYNYQIHKTLIDETVSLKSFIEDAYLQYKQ